MERLVTIEIEESEIDTFGLAMMQITEDLDYVETQT